MNAPQSASASDPLPAPAPPRRWWFDLLPPLVLLLVGTVFFRVTDADRAWLRPWTAGGDWPYANGPLWSALYRFGTYPALVAVVAAVAVLLLGCRRAAWGRWRRHAIFVIALLILGPGLVANTVLKDHWGRPRPREITEFGGTVPFEPVLTVDPVSGGKSFPCGHATMGFFFLAGYFLLRRRRRLLAAGFMAGALVAGGLIGWARAIQGGHFPSDILWAGGIVWVLAAALARCLEIDVLPPADPRFVPVKWAALAVGGLLVPAAVFLVLLATPLDRRDDYAPRRIPPTTTGAVARLRLESATASIRPGATTALRTSAHGFGLPGGGIKSVWKETRDADGTWQLEFKQRRSGLTTELEQDIAFDYAPTLFARLKIVSAGGHLTLALPPSTVAGARRWELELQAGTLTVIDPGRPLAVTVNGERVRRDAGPADRLDRLALKLGPGATWSLVGGP